MPQAHCIGRRPGQEQAVGVPASCARGQGQAIGVAYGLQTITQITTPVAETHIQIGRAILAVARWLRRSRHAFFTLAARSSTGRFLIAGLRYCAYTAAGVPPSRRQ